MKDKIHEAKTHLSRPLARVALALNRRPKKRLLGSAKGEFTVPDDFNDPLPKEIEDLFWK
jgi:antitoxin (DNA-binding transcriptional repressor) of toxin-antitoxin stability system